MAKKGALPTDKHVGSRVRMRRMMLGKSQSVLGDALGLTFQQIQKYEKGTNRISASRLQQLSNILQVPVGFFFEGAPGQAEIDGSAETPLHLTAFLATRDGLALTEAFLRVTNVKLRRSIVALVVELADMKSSPDGASAPGTRRRQAKGRGISSNLPAGRK